MVWIIVVIIVGFLIVWMLYVLVLIVVILKLGMVNDIGVLILVYIVKFFVCYNLIIYVFMYRKV